MVARIKQLMEFKKQNMAQFADGIEVPRAVLSHILTGRNKPSLDVMLKLVSVHQDISINWLLLGEGEMLKEVAQGDLTDAPIGTMEMLTSIMGDQINKVQNNSENKRQLLPSASNEKQVKQIVFFYTDNTFEAYLP
jgi:transcriptional regulator with XRE-family HTH domain